MSSSTPYSYPSPSQTAQLEQLANAVQASPANSDYVSTPGDGRKRRADGRTSSRGVATMTPDQLAKKRANDREAQRAIRERTRNTIESLEKRIKELESQQAFQELQNVIRARDAVMAENEDLKRRLQSILLLAQTHAQGLNDLALATSQQSPLPMPPHGVPAQQQGQHGGFGMPQSFNQQLLHPDLRSLQSPAPTAHMNTSGNVSPANGDYRPSQWSPGDKHSATPAHGPGLSNGTPLYAHLPNNIPPTCPLDSILIDFLAERRRAAAQGAPSSSLVGPAYPSISSLLNPARSAQAHPLSKVFTDILSKFPDIQGLPEKCACLYIMFLVMRWQVAPTPENYERLPEWIRPGRSQLDRPHPAWIDHLPWPAMRDRIISSPSAYPFDSFFIPHTTTMSLNWPYEPGQCFLDKNNRPLSGDSSIDILAKSVDEEGEEYSINPVFESHLRKLENWTIGPMFRDTFPDLMDGVGFKE